MPGFIFGSQKQNPHGKFSYTGRTKNILSQAGRPGRCDRQSANRREFLDLVFDEVYAFGNRAK